ncbi:putative transposase like protein [Trichonephila clavipes]|nr:putative transposase like protein [Trichonephila clavipes]
MWTSGDRSASVMKAQLKFCRTKLRLCVVVVEKSFILTVDCEHPTEIMIWSVISGKGTGRLYVVKARCIKAFLAEQNIPLLDWLGNRPDMNPIENVWELMKREVAKDVITNKMQLLNRVIHVWNHHPQMQEAVQSCIDSMPRRIEALIAAKGGSTKY